MKIFVQLLFVLSSFLPSNDVTMLTSEDENTVPILENNTLSMYVDSEEMLLYFTQAVYDTNKDEMRFVTKFKVSKITILEGKQKKVYKMPVKTNKIRLGLSMFDRGTYEVKFDMEGAQDEISTMLEVF